MDENVDHKERLKNERQHVQIAPNGIAILSIYAHWICPTPQNELLAPRRLFKKHTGEHQGEIISGIRKEYGIEKRICFLTGNNIEWNDVAVHAILRHFTPIFRQETVSAAACDSLVTS